METLTIEYDPHNKAAQQIIDRLASTGIFHIKREATTTCVSSQSDSRRKQILSFANLFSDMNEDTYSDFLNEVQRTRNTMFNRTPIV
jgi:predicted transcriptional regulator YheO